MLRTFDAARRHLRHGDHPVLRAGCGVDLRVPEAAGLRPAVPHAAVSADADPVLRGDPLPAGQSADGPGGADADAGGVRGDPCGRAALLPHLGGPAVRRQADRGGGKTKGRSRLRLRPFTFALPRDRSEDRHPHVDVLLRILLEVVGQGVEGARRGCGRWCRALVSFSSMPTDPRPLVRLRDERADLGMLVESTWRDQPRHVGRRRANVAHRRVDHRRVDQRR